MITFFPWRWSGGSDSKEPAWNVGDLGLIPKLGRSPGGRHGNPLQYFCLENPHGQRSLLGYSPWGCTELGVTEQSTVYFWLTANIQDVWNSMIHNCMILITLKWTPSCENTQIRPRRTCQTVNYLWVWMTLFFASCVFWFPIMHMLTFWWWTGRPGMLRFMASQRVGHDWATELNWTCKK